jgi:HSP20 family protein
MNLGRFFPENAFSTLSKGDDFPWDLGRRRETSESRWIPRADVYESEDKIFVEMDLPGIKRDQIDVTIESGRLIISGERVMNTQMDATHEESEKPTVHRRERHSGLFQREYNLPETVDQDKVEAQLTNGVLKLELSKAEASMPRKVDVQIN